MWNKLSVIIYNQMVKAKGRSLLNPKFSIVFSPFLKAINHATICVLSMIK